MRRCFFGFNIRADWAMARCSVTDFIIRKNFVILNCILLVVLISYYASYR